MRDILPQMRRLRPSTSNRLLIQLKRLVNYKNDFSPDGLLADEYFGRSCNDWSIVDYMEKMNHE